MQWIKQTLKHLLGNSLSICQDHVSAPSRPVPSRPVRPTPTRLLKVGTFTFNCIDPKSEGSRARARLAGKERS
jgi:hypothetical protein